MFQRVLVVFQFSKVFFVSWVAWTGLPSQSSCLGFLIAEIQACAIMPSLGCPELSEDKLGVVAHISLFITLEAQARGLLLAQGWPGLQSESPFQKSFPQKEKE